MTCDQCGQPITVGDWPFCPHGRSALRAVGDDIPGGMVLENLGHEPVTVYSHTERKAIMRARGLQEQIRWTPGDKYLSRWV